MLQNNINEKAIDNEGKTALFYARISGHKEIEELLNNQNSSNEKNELSSFNKTIQSQQTNRNENISLNFKNIEMFNKLPASII